MDLYPPQDLLYHSFSKKDSIYSCSGSCWGKLMTELGLLHVLMFVALRDTRRWHGL